MKSKKRVKKPRDGVYLQMTGSVYLVEVENGKQKRSKFDGKLMLKIIERAIADAVRHYT